MTTRRCQFCGAVLYGRSDKRYCSSTCRRDASRARTRIIRLGVVTFVGSEWSQPIERALIPHLEREYGANHRVVHEARRHAEQLQDARLEELSREMHLLECGDDQANEWVDGGTPRPNG